MTKYYVYPYKQGSQSARLLADTLGGKVLRVVGSTYVQRPGHKVINWGSSHFPYSGDNSTNSVAMAGNKLHTFQMWDQAGCNDKVPPWTVDKAQALTWVSEGKTVFARTKLTGHSGDGIVVLNNNPEATAQLYVQYVKKKKEFRVHVWGESVVVVQEKRRRSGQESHLVRSNANGYVYCFNEIQEPDDLRRLGVQGCKSLGLQHGAVDIIWNEHQNRSYLLEVNTAPGLCPTTATKYAEYITSTT